MHLLYEDISGASAPFVVRLYSLLLGPAFRDWVPPFVIGFHPSSLGSSLHRWASPFVVGFYPSSLCFMPFVLGFYPSSLCFTPFAVGFFHRCVLRPSPLGSTQQVRSPSCGSTRRRQVRKAPVGLNTLVLVGAKAAVRLVGLGVIVVVS